MYSHKAHEKCADILLCRLTRIKIWQIVLSAITTAGFIGTVFSKSEGHCGAGGHRVDHVAGAKCLYKEL